MLRLRPLLRAARCHYEVLGVPRTASDDDIKSAFRELARATHPDAGKDTSSEAGFKDLVEAYRILRDPKRRQDYDNQLRARASASAGGRGRDPGFGPRASSGTAETATVQRSPAEGFMLAGLFLGGAWLLSQALANKTATYKDPDPYPRKLPTAGKYAAKADAAPGEQSERSTSSTASPMEAVSSRAPAVSGNAMNIIESAADRMVRAYFDPYFSRWMRIPDGYEPPGTVDLTAWHHKRTDPTEWSRLHATGELSQIMPRGGLQVRFVPKYETFEPVLVGDPVTGKTVLASKRLPPRVSKEQCEVQF